MGFHEDDRIRRKNRLPPDNSEPPPPPTHATYILELDKNINIGELLSHLFYDFDVRLMDDRKTIAIKPK